VHRGLETQAEHDHHDTRTQNELHHLCKTHVNSLKRFRGFANIYPSSTSKPISFGVPVV
jgi:hypothetical protein